MTKFIAKKWSLCFMLFVMHLIVTTPYKQVQASTGHAGQVNSFYGAFSTEIPIALPVFHGLEPGLKLSYSSSGTNTWVGLGWKLKGISMIERSGKNGEAPRYNENDIYYLDGVELISSVLLGGTHCTKIQNYSRIVKDSATNKWFVWGTNGNKATFSPIYQTSKGTFKWLLSHVVDPHGNEVVYKYWCDGNPIKDCYLDTILYNGTEIKLYREQRQDSYIYANGVTWGQTRYRLKTIDIKVSEDRLRTYCIDYTESRHTGRSLIKSIQQFGRDTELDESGNIIQGSSLPPMVLDYQKNTYDLLSQDHVLKSSGKNDIAYVLSADTNGDGFSDMIHHDTNGKVFIFLSKGDGSYSEAKMVQGPGGESSGYVHMGDVNGDGRSDLVKHDTNGVVYTFLANKNGYFNTYSTSKGSGGKGSGYVGLMDFNGDLCSDLLKIDKDGNVYVALSNCDGTYASSKTTKGPGLNIYFADVDGNNRPDLIKRSAKKIYTYLSKEDGSFESYVTSNINYENVLFEDITGDGKSDLLTYDSNAKVYCYISKGNGTFEYISSHSGSGKKIKLIDINGDDCADLLKRDGSRLYVYYSNGNGTFQSGISKNISNSDFRFGDINGDSRPDIIQVNSNNEIQIFSSNGLSFSDLLIQIENGIGGTTRMAYVPSTKWNNTFLPSGMIFHTVEKITTNDGRDNSSTVNYTYEGGLWSKTQQSFLGFRKVTSVLDSQGNYTVTYYIQRDGSISKPENTYYYDNQKRLYRYSEYVYTENEFPPYYSLMSQRWEYECNLTDHCHKKLVAFAYDIHGNVIATYEFGDYDRSGDEKTHVRGYYPNHDDYIVGLPAYENLYSGIFNVEENPNQETDTQNSQLIEHKLFIYDDNKDYRSPPTKGDLTQIRKWDNINEKYVQASIQYTSSGKPYYEIDERGRETRTQYDTTYHMYETQKCNTLGHCITFEWDTTLGVMLSKTDVENDATIEFTYDEFGRPLSKKQADGSIVTYEHLDIGNPSKQRIREIKPDGTSDGLWTETYKDGLGRHYKIEKEGQFIKQTEYCGTSERIRKKSLWYGPWNTPKWITYSYDGAGRLRKMYNPDGSYSEISYHTDENGYTYEVRYDELRNETVIWRDAYGNVSQVREKNGDEYYYTTYEMDVRGKLIRIVDSAKAVSTNTWDSLGRKIQSCNPDMGCWSYTYDDAGLLLSQTNAKNETIHFIYDALGRMTSKTLPDDVGEINYFYDEVGFGASKGRLTTVKYPSGEEKHIWDKRGFEIETQRCVDDVCKTIERSYDSLGRLSSITYPDNEIVDYQYNENGRLAKVGDFAHAIGWDVTGQMHTMSFANGTRTDFSYDDDRMWLTQALVKGPRGLLYEAKYQYDLSAKVTAMSSSTNDLLNMNFSYDELGRLTNVDGNQRQSFAYDSRGNILSATFGDQLLNQFNNAVYQYDENGNLVSDGSRHFQWSSENRLTAITNNGHTASFEYDSKGIRIKKSGLNGVTRYFGSLVEEVNGDLVKYYYAGPIMIARQDKTGKYWYHSDHLGSVRMMTDANGNIVNQYEYSAFGMTISETEQADNDRGFNAHYQDLESGLIYMKSRYYDPCLGRFISPDTIVPEPYNPQALNRYAYAFNNPISNLDPTGHAPVVAAVAAVVTVAAKTAVVALGVVLSNAKVIGAALSIAGHLTKDPVMSAVGRILLGYSSEGILNATAAGTTSASGVAAEMLGKGMNWVFDKFGNIKELNIPKLIYVATQDPFIQEKIEKNMKNSPGIVREVVDEIIDETKDRAIDQSRKNRSKNGKPKSTSSQDKHFDEHGVYQKLGNVVDKASSGAEKYDSNNVFHQDVANSIDQAGIIYENLDTIDRTFKKQSPSSQGFDLRFGLPSGDSSYRSNR
jgi:RHS repeat-associated protein